MFRSNFLDLIDNYCIKKCMHVLNYYSIIKMIINLKRITDYFFVLISIILYLVKYFKFSCCGKLIEFN